MENPDQITQLQAENRRLRAMCVCLQWMARRYAHGRSSYAPFTVNEVTCDMIKMGIEPAICGEKMIFARDGAEGQPDGKDGQPYKTLKPALEKAERCCLQRDYEGARAALEGQPWSRHYA